jgi:hypothetical protein
MSSDVSISAALTTAHNRYVEGRTFNGPADAARESNTNACTGVWRCARASVTRLLPMCHPQLDGCLINWEQAYEGESQRCSVAEIF